MKHLAASAADIHLAGDSKELYAIKYGGKDNVHPGESGANLLAELFLCTVRARVSECRFRSAGRFSGRFSR